MSGYGYSRKWLRASKALEHHVSGGPWANSWEDAEYQLYMAVVDGEVRSRVDLKELEDPSILIGQKFHDTNPYCLPFDLEVNLDDVYRVWNWDAYDIADVIAYGKLSNSQASMRVEVTILNFHRILTRLAVRLNTESLKTAKSEISFDEKWAKYDREFQLITKASILSEKQIESWKEKYQTVINRKNAILNSFTSSRRKPGRKEKYDWAAARSHITYLFSHHGPLSPDDPEWSSQADIERAIKAFFYKEIGVEPATSTVREKAKEFITLQEVNK